MKKVIEGMVMASLLTASLAAFAEGGGDTVVAQMDAARQRSMEHLRQVVKERATASTHSEQQPQLKADPVKGRG